MMTKYARTDDQPDLVAACSGRLMEFLSPNDRVKAAKSEVITRKILQDHAPDDDHFAVMNIGFGVTPWYQENKNADGFDDKTAAERVGTFVTHGAVYEEHAHHDRSLAKGVIKFAGYNPEMKRTELILHINKRRMPDAYEMAKVGKELGFSMGCKIAGDVSECCNKFARNRTEYCDHMKERARQYIPERQKYAFVWNPKPTFFDMSRVKKPADRIAYSLAFRLPDGSKTAHVSQAHAQSVDESMGVKLASVNSGISEFGKFTVDAARLMQATVESTDSIKTGALNTACANYVNMVSPYLPVFVITQQDVDVMSELRPSTVFAKLAQAGAVLPPDAFFSYVLNRRISDIRTDAAVKWACAMMPSIHIHISSSASDVGLTPADAELFSTDAEQSFADDPYMNASIDGVMQSIADKCCRNPEAELRHVTRDPSRIEFKIAGDITGRQRAAITNADLRIKSAACNTSKTSRALASIYAAYQIAAIGEMRKYGMDVPDLNYIATSIAATNVQYGIDYLS